MHPVCARVRLLRCMHLMHASCAMVTSPATIRRAAGCAAGRAAVHGIAEPRGAGLAGAATAGPAASFSKSVTCTCVCVHGRARTCLHPSIAASVRMYIRMPACRRVTISSFDNDSEHGKARSAAWRGVAWRGMARCGTGRGMARCSVVWRRAAWSVTRHGVAWGVGRSCEAHCDTARRRAAWHRAWCRAVRHGMAQGRMAQGGMLKGRVVCVDM